MGFPTLRYPRLCRILTYIVVLGVFLLPMIVIASLPFVPGVVKVAVLLVGSGGLLVYLYREFLTLMTLDMSLAFLSCYRTARTEYALPACYGPEQMTRKLSRYGQTCTPTALLPQPFDLRYKFSFPWTVYSSGIERVVAAYHTQLLDADTYRAIVSSGKANSKALIGRKKAFFLDKQQKKSPLNRVTVILIFAQQVDPRLVGRLYDLVCKQCGDDGEDSVLPCIIDLSRGCCTFNSLRIPYLGFSYAAKNRGIRLIRQLVLNGRFPLAENRNTLPQKDPISLDQSLWAFWKTLRSELGIAASDIDKKLKRMKNKEISVQEDLLYLKWGERGIVLEVQEDPDTAAVILEEPSFWTYPKSQPIAKKTIQDMKQELLRYYANRNRFCRFGLSSDDHS